MPFAATAARLARRAPGGAWEAAVLPSEEGRAFVTLPLPVETGLPVHINGRWQVGDDRNTLAASSHAESYEWNRKLAEHVAAAAYARLVRALATGTRRRWESTPGRPRATAAHIRLEAAGLQLPKP